MNDQASEFIENSSAADTLKETAILADESRHAKCKGGSGGVVAATAEPCRGPAMAAEGGRREEGGGWRICHGLEGGAAAGRADPAGRELRRASTAAAEGPTAVRT